MLIDEPHKKEDNTDTAENSSLPQTNKTSETNSKSQVLGKRKATEKENEKTSSPSDVKVILSF